MRALLVALAVALALPAVAFAHAGLLSTTPGGDSVIAEAPKEVVLRFTEPVDASTATVQVLDGVAKPVPTGALRQPDDRQIVVPLEGTLARGTYTVVWKVISRDQDPVDGVFVFHVSTRGAAALAPASGRAAAARAPRRRSRGSRRTCCWRCGSRARSRWCSSPAGGGAGWSARSPSPPSRSPPRR